MATTKPRPDSKKRKKSEAPPLTPTSLSIPNPQTLQVLLGRSNPQEMLAMTATVDSGDIVAVAISAVEDKARDALVKLNKQRETTLAEQAKLNEQLTDVVRTAAVAAAEEAVGRIKALAAFAGFPRPRRRSKRTALTTRSGKARR